MSEKIDQTTRDASHRKDVNTQPPQVKQFAAISASLANKSKPSYSSRQTSQGFLWSLVGILFGTCGLLMGYYYILVVGRAADAARREILLQARSQPTSSTDEATLATDRPSSDSRSSLNVDKWSRRRLELQQHFSHLSSTLRLPPNKELLDGLVKTVSDGTDESALTGEISTNKDILRNMHIRLSQAANGLIQASRQADSEIKSRARELLALILFPESEAIYRTDTAADIPCDQKRSQGHKKALELLANKIDSIVETYPQGPNADVIHDRLAAFAIEVKQMASDAESHCNWYRHLHTFAWSVRNQVREGMPSVDQAKFDQVFSDYLAQCKRLELMADITIDQRNKFKYGRDSYVHSLGDGEWEEVVDGKPLNHFIEVARTKEFVELQDKVRVVRLRLAPHSLSCIGDTSRDWQDWQSGNWETTVRSETRSADAGSTAVNNVTSTQIPPASSIEPAKDTSTTKRLKNSQEPRNQYGGARIDPDTGIVTGGAEGWIDLVSLSQGFEWHKYGYNWNSNLATALDGREIVLKSQFCNKFPLPFIVTGSYEAEFSVTPRGGGVIVVIFPVADKMAHLEFASPHEVWMALRHDRREKRPLKVALRDGVPQLISISVEILPRQQARIGIKFNGAADDISWTGRLSELHEVGPDPNCWRPSMLEHFCLGSWNTLATYTKASVRPKENGLVVAQSQSPNEQNGVIKLINLPCINPTVGWSEFMVNQLPMNPLYDWPMISELPQSANSYIGAHAPSAITIMVPKGARSFSVVGRNESSRHTSFNIMVDGQIAVDSGPASNAELEIDLPRNARQIQLIVDALGDSGGDCSYWCWPRFHKRVKNALQDRDLTSTPGRGLGFDFIPATATVGWGECNWNTTIDPWIPPPVSREAYVACHEFLYAHANSSLTYKIPEGVLRFTCIAYCQRSHDVDFQVLLDGQSAVAPTRAGIFPIDISCAGAKTITLVAGNRGNRTFDHAMWCYPRFHTK